MIKGYYEFIEKTRTWRSRILEPVGNGLVWVGFTANFVTFLSLLTGLTALYYLFSNYIAFVLLAIVHLFFDGIDGVVARLNKVTEWGKYFDIGTDSLISILAVFKVGWYLSDLYASIIGVLFTIGVIIHLYSKFKAPLIYIRTVSLIVLMIVGIPGFPWEVQLLTMGYLVVGVLTLFSLGKQLQYFVSSR